MLPIVLSSARQSAATQRAVEDDATSTKLIQAQADVEVLKRQLEISHTELESAFAAQEERDSLSAERQAWMNTLQSILDDFESLPAEYQPTGSPFKHLGK
jgi:hypothetical protein